jgi:hypothetical protein
MHKSALHIGVDESNHHSYRGEEVIAAVFSRDAADARARVCKSRNLRDYAFMRRWLAYKGRDYRFTSVPNRKGASPRNNLVNTLPYLVQDYMRTCEDMQLVDIDSAVLHIDGGLSELDLRTLELKLDRILPAGFEIKKYPKGSVPEGPFNYPVIVEIADVLAHFLYLQSPFNHERDMFDREKAHRFVRCFTWTRT